MDASLFEGWHIVFMALPSPWIVSLTTALAGISWILFARSQRGRFQANVLLWLCLPFFFVSISYAGFEYFDPSFDVRAIYARLGFLMISIPQALILTILYLLNRGEHGSS